MNPPPPTTKHMVYGCYAGTRSEPHNTELKTLMFQ